MAPIYAAGADANTGCGAAYDAGTKEFPKEDAETGAGAASPVPGTFVFGTG